VKGGSSNSAAATRTSADSSVHPPHRARHGRRRSRLSELGPCQRQRTRSTAVRMMDCLGVRQKRGVRLNRLNSRQMGVRPAETTRERLSVTLRALSQASHSQTEPLDYYNYNTEPPRSSKRVRWAAGGPPRRSPQRCQSVWGARGHHAFGGCSLGRPTIRHLFRTERLSAALGFALLCLGAQQLAANRNGSGSG
jgi:hypothetical protein